MQAEAPAFATLEQVLTLPSVAYADRRTLLPDQPGLYFAVRGSAEVLYVGMASKSIRRRWLVSHAAASKINRDGLAGNVRIAYALYDDIAALRNDERVAIRTLCPPLNFHHVPGALEREHQRNAEACRWINCGWHDHRKWPQQETPTKPAPSWSDLVGKPAAE